MSNNSSELLDEARAINSSLSRVQQTLSFSVSQTVSAATILNHDTVTINETVHEHKHELNAALKSTRQRLSRLQLSERYETIALQVAIAFFTCVVIYIVLSRTQVFYWVLRMFFCRQPDATRTEL